MAKTNNSLEIEKEAIAYTTVKNIVKIIKEVEEEVDEIFEKSTLTKPISSDIVLTKRNMAYNEIKAEIKKMKKKLKENKTKRRKDEE